LGQLLAILVGRRAAEADAICDHFARAITAIEVALTAELTVLAALHGTRITLHLAAALLQLSADVLVVARAVDLAAGRALFNADFALRHGRVGVLRGTRTLVQNCIGHDRTP
jgi:hypothetical protein